MRSAFRTFFDDATASAAMAATVLFCFAMPAAAQDARAAGEACARIADSLERLMCYDRTFRPTSAADGSASLPGAPAGAAPAPAGVAPAPAGVAPSPSASSAPASSAAAPAAAASSASAAAAATPPATAAAPTAAPAATTPTEKPADVPIVVTAISELRGGDARFTTQDGQLWIQTDGRRNIYPTLPFDAVIRAGAMGSAFLVPPSGRGVRVRRGP